jgi:hypothetical protein
MSKTSLFKSRKSLHILSGVYGAEKMTREDDWEYYGKKDVYPPKIGEPCLDGKLCCKLIAEWGYKCRHGDCTWYCPLKLQREEEKRKFEEMRDWMRKNRK